MRLLAGLLAVLVAATGCTSAHGQMSTVDDGSSAAVRPDLTGTWRGTAFAVPGSSYLVSTGVELEIEPGGTWTWKAGGRTRARGVLVRNGGDVILQAGPSAGTPGAAADMIWLQQQGDHLWGVSRYFIPGAPSSLDLRREQPVPRHRESQS